MTLISLPKGMSVIQVPSGSECYPANSPQSIFDSVEEKFTCTEFENVMSSNHSGAWKYSLNTNRLVLCPVSSRMLEVEGGELFNFFKVVRHLAKLKAFEFIKALKIALRNQAHLEEEIKIQSKSGIISWLKITGDFYHYDGYNCKMMGMISDVTEFKNKEERGMNLMAFLNHELRTPLSVAKIYIQKTHQLVTKQNNKKVGDMLAKADYQTVRMTVMIENFLTLSRLEAATMIVQATSFNIGEMISELISDLKLISPRRQFSVVKKQPVIVRADPEKIRQVLNNYLTNAVKYSPENSTIHLKFSRQSGHVTVAVGDEGMGISMEDQALLFNRYYRVHEKDRIRAGGFGLGLFLSREIIENHGGQVWVESKFGIGSTFGFTLPDRL